MRRWAAARTDGGTPVPSPTRPKLRWSRSAQMPGRVEGGTRRTPMLRSSLQLRLLREDAGHLGIEQELGVDAHGLEVAFDLQADQGLNPQRRLRRDAKSCAKSGYTRHSRTGRSVTDGPRTMTG